MTSTWTELQRVVFPQDGDPDVLPLFVDADVWARFGTREVRVSDRAHIDDVLGRDRFRVASGERMSFAGYFNAFPASYWQHWTVVDRVRLRATTSGSGTLLVYRSTAQGVPQRVASEAFSGEAAVTLVELPVTTFGDGGWYWFDIVAGRGDVVLSDAAWETDVTPVRDGRASIGITTMNKPDYCVRTLDALASDETVGDVLDRVYVVDQGTQLVREREEYPELAERLGDRLEVIEQANLGGSGGFARSMLETLEAGASDYVILLDDDVTIEPESIVRAVRFARYATQPVLVGGHMFRPARPAGHARVRRDHGHVPVHVARPAARRGPARLPLQQPPADAVDARAHGRGLQRLVVLPHPRRRPSSGRAGTARVHQVG
ncbi:glycosyltransferase [Agromyces flavus]|uniref:glycosyltransferase n=1 Tax=Agromyces flavus TaxID=589382 RepID=UPI003619CF8F